MSTLKRDPFRSGPKTIKRTADVKGDRYPVKRASKKAPDFREERSDSGERRPGVRSYGFEKRDNFEKREERRAPMPVTRRTYTPPPRVSESGASAVAAPSAIMQPVSAYKLRKGLEAAKAEISEMIEAISSTLTDSYNVREVELAVSFGTDGKFIGFGAGGAATIKIRIASTK